MNLHQRLLLFRQLAALLEAGISMRRSVSMLELGNTPALRRCLQDLEAQLVMGQPLSVAIARYPRYFDAWTISLLKTAEYSGTLVATCTQIVTDTERQLHYRRLYRSILISGFAVVVSLVWVAIALFNGTWLSQIVPWLVFVAIVSGGLAWLSGAPMLDRAFFGILQRLPIAKPLLEARAMLYLAELALPLAAGASLTAALDLLRANIPDSRLKQTLTIAAHHVRQGKPLSHSLQHRIPSNALQLIRTGEETGDLSTMLQSLADHYKSELELQLRKLQALLRPLGILAFGGIVLILGIQLIRALSAALPG